MLKKALPDLFTFAGVFMISVLAFSSIFHLVLGSVMVEYNDKFASFVSLGRALFGDFDINEVLENSPSYMNSIIYLAYLFVAVFILLSMFLAILGEAQANLRDDQRVELKSKAAAGEPLPSEYGVLDSAFNLVVVGVEKVPFIGPKIKEKRKRVKEEELEKQAQSKKVTPVDRIEARQLELQDKLDESFNSLRQSLDAIGQRVDLLSAAGASSGTSVGTGGGVPKDRPATPPLLINGSPEAAVHSGVPGSADPSAVILQELQRLEAMIAASTATHRSRRRRTHKTFDDGTPELNGEVVRATKDRRLGAVPA